MSEWKLKPGRLSTYIWKDWVVYKTLGGAWCLKNGVTIVNYFRLQEDARAFAEREEAKRG